MAEKKAKKNTGKIGKETPKAKKQEKKTAETVVKETKSVKPEGGQAGLSLDVTWVAVLVILAFFAGFMVKGFFPAQAGVSTQILAPSVNPTSMPGGGANQGVCPVTGKSGSEAPALDAQGQPLSPTATAPSESWTPSP